MIKGIRRTSISIVSLFPGCHPIRQCWWCWNDKNFLITPSHMEQFATLPSETHLRSIVYQIRCFKVVFFSVGMFLLPHHQFYRRKSSPKLYVSKGKSAWLIAPTPTHQSWLAIFSNSTLVCTPYNTYYRASPLRISNRLTYWWKSHFNF